MARAFHIYKPRHQLGVAIKSCRIRIEAGCAYLYTRWRAGRGRRLSILKNSSPAITAQLPRIYYSVLPLFQDHPSPSRVKLGPIPRAFSNNTIPRPSSHYLNSSSNTISTSLHSQQDSDIKMTISSHQEPYCGNDGITVLAIT
jgi:hypothetical protein